MILTLIRSPSHSQMRITVRSSQWNKVFTVDDSHKHLEVTLPAELAEDDVEAYQEFLTRRGEVDQSIGSRVLKTKKRLRRGLRHGNNQGNV